MRRSRAAELVVAAVLVLAGTGCASDKQGSGGLAAAPAPTASSPAASVTATAPATEQTTKPATGSTTTKPAAPRGPSFVSLTVEQKPSCPGTGPDVTYPGSDLKVKWKTVRATAVAISLDDKDWYKNHGTGSYGSDYPATGEMELSFACDTTQPNTTHVYTFDAYDGTKYAEKTLTFTEPSNP